jgi:hypothetical protein
LRPTIPERLPPWLKELIARQWDNCPTHRLPFDECAHLISKNSGRQFNALSVRRNAFAAQRARQVGTSLPEVTSSIVMETTDDFPCSVALGNQCWVALKSGRLLCIDPISREVIEKEDVELKVNILCLSGGYVWAGCGGGLLAALECPWGEGRNNEGPVQVGTGGADITCVLAISHELLLIGDSCGGLYLFSQGQREVVAEGSIGSRKSILRGCVVTESRDCC